MPTTSPIGATNWTAPQPSTTPTALQGLGSDGFLRLLVAQMRYQNPMAPSDTDAMLAQTGMLAQVESMQNVSAMQRQLFVMQSAALASDLIGKEVSAITSSGIEITGVVDSVRFSATGPVLVIGDHEVSVDQATEIRPASSSTGPTDPDNGNDD